MENENKELQKELAKSELAVILISQLHNFKSKEAPDIILSENDMNCVLSKILTRRLSQ